MSIVYVVANWIIKDLKKSFVRDIQLTTIKFERFVVS